MTQEVHRSEQFKVMCDFHFLTQFPFPISTYPLLQKRTYFAPSPLAIYVSVHFPTPNDSHPTPTQV